MQSLQSIKTTLKNIKPELARKFYVSEIGLFGSVTRSDFNETSDIDIVVSFNRSVGIEFIDLAEYLENTLHQLIDLISRQAMTDRFFTAIKNEIQFV